MKKDHVDPMQMRRIGLRHAIVVPVRKAVVFDMNAVDQKIAEVDRKLEALARKRVELEQERSALSATRAGFDAMPIEREEGDPEVPLEPPPSTKQAHAERLAKARAEEAAAEDANPKEE